MHLMPNARIYDAIPLQVPRAQSGLAPHASCPSVSSSIAVTRQLANHSFVYCGGVDMEGVVPVS